MTKAIRYFLIRLIKKRITRNWLQVGLMASFQIIPIYLEQSSNRKKPCVHARFLSYSIQLARPRVQLARPRVQLARPQVQLARPRVQLARPRVQLARPRVQLARPQVQLARPRVQLARPRFQLARRSVVELYSIHRYINKILAP